MCRVAKRCVPLREQRSPRRWGGSGETDSCDQQGKDEAATTRALVALACRVGPGARRRGGPRLRDRVYPRRETRVGRRIPRARLEVTVIVGSTVDGDVRPKRLVLGLAAS